MHAVTEDEKMTDEELKALLITCDNKGKDSKTIALDLLLGRSYHKGYQACNELAYKDTHKHHLLQ